jgi:hypothetical protein
MTVDESKMEGRAGLASVSLIELSRFGCLKPNTQSPFVLIKSPHIYNETVRSTG